MKDVVIKDTPAGKALERELKRLCNCVVHVGYQAGDADHEGVDMVDIVAFNEFGTSMIPSRPFMRTTAEKHEDEIVKFAQAQLNRVIAGKTDAGHALVSEGVYVKGLVQKTIVEEKWTPNAPYTIAKKGSDKPLIDTGLMRQSVIFEIEERSD